MVTDKKKKKRGFSLFRRRPSKKDLTADGTDPLTPPNQAMPIVDALPGIPASPRNDAAAGGGGGQYRQDLNTKSWYRVAGGGDHPSEVHMRNSPGGTSVSAVTHETGLVPPSVNGAYPLPQSYGFSTPERKARDGSGRGSNRHQPVALLPGMEGDETTVGDGSQLLPPPAPGIGATRSGSAKGGKKSDRAKKAGHSSFWSRSHQFRKLSDWAFDVVDADKSGHVDKKELYSGLLLIHLNLASYMGPAACRPATREYVETIFDKMDDDRSGSLDRDEFAEVMAVLCGQVMTRVVMQWSMTLMIVPLLAQYVLDGFLWGNRAALDFWSGIDPVRALWDRAMEMVADAAQQHVPEAAWTAWDTVCHYWAMIPESVLEVLPLTIISCVLGGIAVPYMLFRIDDFFHGMADKKKEGKRKNV